MRYLSSFFLLFSSFALASEVDISQTDIIPRSINFIIFVLILWFLFAGKLKAFLQERREKISLQFSEVQDKLKIAKKEKEQALRKLEEAKETAAEIIANAKKESYLVAQKIEEQTRADIEVMMKNAEALMSFETKQMEKEVVMEVLDEVFAENRLDAHAYGSILEKRLAK